MFKFAVKTVPDTVSKSLEKAGMSEDIDFLVMHQANQRIIDTAAKRFGLGPEKVVSNVAKCHLRGIRPDRDGGGCGGGED